MFEFNVVDWKGRRQSDNIIDLRIEDSSHDFSWLGNLLGAFIVVAPLLFYLYLSSGKRN